MVKHCRIGRVLVATVFVTGLLLSSDAWAREGPLYQTSRTTRITRKLVRGCANTVFGWCEIPRNIHIGIEDLDPFTGTVVGLVRGTGQGIVRTSWGLWEVVTFPIPFPSEYRNKVKPEFIWQDLFE